MELTEIYADAEGETHFRKVEIHMELCDFAPPSKPINLSADMPSTSSVFLTAPPGWDKEYHATPRKQLAVMLMGEATIAATDGDIVEVGPGDTVLLNDQGSKGHLTQIQGAREATFLLIGINDES